MIDTHGIREVIDFPKEGIAFKDITPLLADPDKFTVAIDAFENFLKSRNINKIVAIDARGFLLGSVVAYKMKLPLVLVRKEGKLPYTTQRFSYILEYGTDTLEMHIDSIAPVDRVAIFDDLLATGGTASAANELIHSMGGTVVANCFLVELSYLGGNERLTGEVYSYIKYN